MGNKMGLHLKSYFIMWSICITPFKQKKNTIKTGVEAGYRWLVYYSSTFSLLKMFSSFLHCYSMSYRGFF